MPQRPRLVLVEIRATSADTAALDFAFDRLAFSPLLAASTPLSNLFLRDLNDNSVDRSRLPPSRVETVSGCAHGSNNTHDMTFMV